MEAKHTIAMTIGSSVSTQSLKALQLALIVPSSKERDNIVPLNEKVFAALEDRNFEFLVVNDNSPDEKANVIGQLTPAYPNVRCIQRFRTDG